MVGVIDASLVLTHLRHTQCCWRPRRGAEDGPLEYARVFTTLVTADITDIARGSVPRQNEQETRDAKCDGIDMTDYPFTSGPDALEGST